MLHFIEILSSRLNLKGKQPLEIISFQWKIIFFANIILTWKDEMRIA